MSSTPEFVKSVNPIQTMGDYAQHTDYGHPESSTIISTKNEPLYPNHKYRDLNLGPKELGDSNFVCP